MSDYFDETMVNRQRLFWTVATRRQLERWEPLVATFTDALIQKRDPDPIVVWAAKGEHHFALIAARNLLHALDLDPETAVAIDATVRAELIEGRDLHEHWVDNLPVFLVTPRRAEPPRRSGKAFAERNPDRGPYSWLSWNSGEGALLMPHVSAPALHELLDDVEASVLARNPTLGGFVPPRAPSPWIHVDGEWWPPPRAS